MSNVMLWIIPALPLAAVAAASKPVAAGAKRKGGALRRCRQFVQDEVSQTS